MDALVAHCKRLGTISSLEGILCDGPKVMCAGKCVDTFDGIQLLVERVKACFPDGNFDPLPKGVQEAVQEATGFRVEFKFKLMALFPEGPEPLGT